MAKDIKRNRNGNDRIASPKIVNSELITRFPENVLVIYIITRNFAKCNVDTVLFL
jgi:hypothetical protein